MTGSNRPALSRRALIGSGLAADAAVLATSGSASAAASGGASAPAADRPPAARASAPRRAGAFLAAAMDAYPDHGPVRLAQSYRDSFAVLRPSGRG
ncbi:hypothetical protein ABZ330_13715 [Streptomyces sp. NPDC006172]|uniref:hypothetical protein n=1 Tax=Streptomyces sp. NPDC006172 TaxID=3154470 RepID=UPI0033E3B8C2